MFGAVIYVISLQQMAVNKANQSQSKAIEQRTILCERRAARDAAAPL